MRDRQLELSAFTLVGAFLLLLLPGSAATIELRPVASTGPCTIDRNEIGMQEGGVEVTVEIRLSGWGAERNLGSYYATIDSGGYSSGFGDPLIPKGWPESPEDGAFINQSRPDFVFFDNIAVPGVDTETLNYMLGACQMGGAEVDLGTSYYGGTLILEVPPGAAGTYAIDFVPGRPYTALLPEGCAMIEFPLEYRPAFIRVGDCQPNGIPDEQDILGGTSEDCDGNGIPDECERDRDGDGVIDACDPCPQDNPDDTDGDGVCESDDLCPGEPDIDSDGDSVPDCLDQCPGIDDTIDFDADGVPDCVQAIPTVSAWGVVILALLLMVGGKVYFGGRRATGRAV